MNKDPVTLERQGKVALVKLNRPERKNAFDEALLQNLEKVTCALQNDLPRAVVLSGEGDVFSAGFDVNPDNPLVIQLLQAMEKHDPDSGKILISRIRKALDPFVTLPVPVISAINGLAYGGGAELAMRCDLRVMDPAAIISFSEVKLGLMPDMGGGVALANLVGTAVASDLILTARKIEADEALKLGLANRISSNGKSVDEALQLAEMISENGPKAVQSALCVIRQTSELSGSEALKLEMETASKLLATGECLVGVTAFLEKKKPEFPD